MDYLQQLLNNQPVEWKKLGEVAQYSKTRIDASLLNENNYVGVDNMLQNCKGKTFSEHVPTTGRFTAYAPKNILIGNIRPYLKKIWFADNEGGTNGDVLVIQTTDERVLPEYLYQVLSDDAFFSYDMQHAKGAKMPRGNKDKILDYIIPIPPLSVQSRIVEILDKFTAMEAELEEQLQAELELRKKQYAYYREQLLNFSYTPPSEFNVVYRKLGEVFITRNGYTPSKSNPEYWEGGTIPWYRMEDIRENGRILSDSLQHITPKGVKGNRLFNADSIILATSATIGEHALITTEALANQRFTNFEIKEDFKDILLSKFVFYYFYVIDDWCKNHIYIGNFPSVDVEQLKKMDFPIPPLSEQERIVEILDKFDTLTNSISEGLPLEIQLRRQQYEYYREQLLDFRR